jgi:hypothetical protein
MGKISIGNGQDQLQFAGQKAVAKTHELGKDQN